MSKVQTEHPGICTVSEIPFDPCNNSNLDQSNYVYNELFNGPSFTARSTIRFIADLIAH